MTNTRTIEIAVAALYALHEPQARLVAAILFLLCYTDRRICDVPFASVEGDQRDGPRR